MKTLPEACVAKNMYDEDIMILKGEEGYYKLDPSIDGERFNELSGVTDEVIRIMTCASMFGWDIPAVKNYEEEIE
jgi:hypothetical protein